MKKEVRKKMFKMEDQKKKKKSNACIMRIPEDEEKKKKRNRITELIFKTIIQESSLEIRESKYTF